MTKQDDNDFCGWNSTSNATQALRTLSNNRIWISLIVFVCKYVLSNWNREKVIRFQSKNDQTKSRRSALIKTPLQVRKIVEHLSRNFRHLLRSEYMINCDPRGTNDQHLFAKFLERRPRHVLIPFGGSRTGRALLFAFVFASWSWKVPKSYKLG